MENVREFLIFNLKKFRKVSRFTQAELAEAAEMTLTGYQHIEYGKAWVSPETLDKLAKALSVSPSDLLKAPSDGQSKSDLIIGIIKLLPSIDLDHLDTIFMMAESVVPAESPALAKKA